MANVITYDSSTFQGIKQLSTAELDGLYAEVLDYIANNLTSPYASLNTVSGDLVGTFTDTSWTQPVGQLDTTPIETIYNVYSANTIEGTTNPPTALTLSVAGSEVSLTPQGQDMNAVADEIIARLVDTGAWSVGSYYLGEAAPSDGGTWSSIATITDTTDNSTTTQATYYIWKKIDEGARTVYRPLKLVNTDLQLFTDNEIHYISKTVQERIQATGIGTYALQETAPVTGVWQSCGTIIDTRHITTPTDFNYVSTFTGVTPTSRSGPSFASPNVYYVGTSPIPLPAGYLGPTIAPWGLVPNGAYYSGTTTTGYYNASKNYVLTYFGTTTVAYDGLTYTNTQQLIEAGYQTISTLTLWRRIS